MSGVKVPTRIIDVNGKETTVHKNPNVSPASLGHRVASIGTPSLRKPRTIADDQIELTYISDELTSLFVPRVPASFVFEVSDSGPLEITDVIDDDGYRIYQKFSDNGSLSSVYENGIEAINSNLNSLGLERAVDSGLVAADGTGSFVVVFEDVASFKA